MPYEKSGNYLKIFGSRISYKLSVIRDDLEIKTYITVICDKDKITEKCICDHINGLKKGVFIMPLPRERIYTIDDIYALPEGERAELIDGQIYMMAPPNTRHQVIVGELYATIRNYIKNKGGSCKPYISPFAVFLNEDNRNYVEPDLTVVCSPDKIDEKGCHGAPDWIIEVVSPATQSKDYGVKLFKYRMAGVREYWIINPLKDIVNVYDFENESGTGLYSFEDEIPVCIYPNLSIVISELF